MAKKEAARGQAATSDNRVEAKEGGDDADLRLILVGKSRGGKSATGNNILGQRVFESALAAKTTTRALQTGQGTWEGKKITVIVTPALFDSKEMDQLLKKEMKNCHRMCQLGLYAFILVTQVGRFTKEDKDATKRVREIFGKKVHPSHDRPLHLQGRPGRGLCAGVCPKMRQ